MPVGPFFVLRRRRWETMMILPVPNFVIGPLNSVRMVLPILRGMPYWYGLEGYHA